MPNAKKIIYSLRVNLELQKRGFSPVGVSENPRKKGFICWVYEKTEELDAALDEILGVSSV